jgi:hypothetical protein
MDADQYVINEGDLVEDAPEAVGKHQTSVQAGGWSDAAKLMDKKEGDYATDFKFSEEARLVKFLEDNPFAVYEQFWIEKEGKKSYVSLGSDDPLAVVAGQTARGKFAFNVLVLTDDEPNLQVLTASPGLARQLKAANDDPRRGPLTRHYWSISRQGTGPTTLYSLERVKRDDLAEEWEVDPERVDAVAANVKPYDSSIIRVLTYDEHMEVAQALVGIK